MSIIVISKVLGRQLGSPTRKMVMIAMADVANEDGGGIWKSASTIAAQCEISRATVLRVWRELSDSEVGILKRTGKKAVRGGEVIVWEIDLNRLEAMPRPGIILEPGDDADPADPVSPCYRVDPVAESDPVSLTHRPGIIDASDPVSQCNTIRPIIRPETSKAQAPEIGLADALWQLTPAASKKRSSKKELEAACRSALKRFEAGAILKAWSIVVADRQSIKEDHKHLPGVHRWVNKRLESHIEATAAPSLLESTDQHEAEELDMYFAAFAKHGVWPTRTHLRQPDDLKSDYPAELYAKHGLKPPKRSQGGAPDDVSMN